MGKNGVQGKAAGKGKATGKQNNWKRKNEQGVKRNVRGNRRD
jgi:hypothetical protein